ncbi:MAG: GNAT family N-acetyltransferase [Firmicutes bacterium]|nr:GNAT family N-acetyltransferase [Bacillota bacterium]
MGDMVIKINETGKYEELIPLFRASGLEIHVDEENKPPAMITCWRADIQGKTEGGVAGGVSIEEKGGFFVIGDIAVREDLRGEDVGSLLLARAMERIYELGGDEIYLVAKAPKFFEKFGFTYLTPEEAPDIFNCKDCDQRGVKCYPEFMKFEFDE